MGSEQPRRRENVDAIVAYFVGGVKDEAKSIGIELEHTLVKDGGEPVSYDDEFGQLWLLNQLGPEYDSEIRSSAGNLIGLLREGASITLEPAAQVELSAGPFDSLEDAKREFMAFEERLERELDPHGISLLTPGYHPTRRAIDLKLIPKRRYEFMNQYLEAISMYGVCMMRGSAATQVSIDYTSIDDCLRKMRLACACVPLFSLICDNTPAFEGDVRPHQLMRTEVWEKCDPDRCMIVPGMMDAGFTLEQYANYILDTPAVVEIVNGREEFTEKTFGEIHANAPMTHADVEHALSMFFNDVRLKTYIEIRPADAMPVECAIAYAAMIKGLFYDKGALDALDELLGDVNERDVAAAKAALMADGYAAKVYGHAASTVADELVSIARSGLSASDAALMEPIAELVANRVTLADIALETATDQEEE